MLLKFFIPFSSQIIQNSKKLNLTVRSVGRIPVSFVAESTCKWVDMRGRRASPPPGVDSNGRILTADGIHKSDLRLLGDDDERKVCQKYRHLKYFEVRQPVMLNMTCFISFNRFLLLKRTDQTIEQEC